MVMVRRCDGFRSGSSHHSPDRLFLIFSRHRRSLSFLSVPVSCCCYRSGLLARILLGFCFSGGSCCFPTGVVVVRHGSGGLVSWWWLDCGGDFFLLRWGLYAFCFSYRCMFVLVVVAATDLCWV
ncbi:hypothetical protein QL285_066576 [Trifolium repens]|nr:hypothetical protein QL285_066576 [Trifolium repens]